MKTPQIPSKMNLGRSSHKKLLTTIVALVSVAAVSRADHYYTNNAAGDYNVASYWDPNGVPNDNTHNNNGSANIVLIQPGDPIWNHGDTLAGSVDGASGAYLQTGSTNNTGGGNWLRMGLNVGAYGSYVISNGVCNVGGRIQIGEHGTGYLEVSGGAMNANVNDHGANPGLVAGDGNFNAITNNSPVGTVVLDSGTLNIGNGEIWFGNGGNNINSRGTGHFIMHGGTFNANNWFVFGRFGAAGDGYMDGGVINKNNNGNVQIGVGSMNSGATGGQGYFTQMGGTFNCASEYQVGTDSSSTTATNDIGGNAVLKVDNWIAVGRGGALGVMNISDNAAITKTSVNGGNVTIGTGSTGNGTINQNGGAFTNTVSQTWISEGGSGTWNMNAGLAILGAVQLAHANTGSGLLNLNGGLFRATGISSPNPSVTTALDFNGGTLQAGADNTAFISGITYLLMDAGGAVIDSQGFNIGITEALLDSAGGGLTKLGSGTLTLSGANSYIGDTVVSAGTLATTTASTGGGNYSVADGAALGVTVVSANGSLGMSSLTLGSATGATLDIDLGSFGNPSSAPIAVAGALNVGGTISVNIADSNPNFGQFPLIQYGSGSGGTFVLSGIPFGVGAYISNNVTAQSIDLVITNVNLPRWEGLAGGDWDIGLTTNWINIGNGLPTFYVDGNNVLFDDNAQGTTDVNLTTTVSPNTLTVDNSALTYAFGGSGKISGPAGINKIGSGVLVVTNTGGNDYTGQTVISGGSVDVTSLANGGSPSAIGAASSNPTNLVLSGGSLVYSGPTVTIDRGYSVAGTNQSGINVASDLTLSGMVAASGSGSFVKSGAATLAYTTVGNNNLSAGSYEVQAGTLRLDGSAGVQTNIISAHLGLNGVTDATAVLTNTTLNCGDFYIANQANMTGSAEIDSGTTINDNSWFILGDGTNGVATLTMNGGTLNVPNGRFFLCSAPGTIATFNMNGGTFNKSGDYYAIVNGGWNGQGARTGIVNQVNGTINSASECWIGDGGGTNASSSLGVYNLSGGTLSVSNWFGIGRDGARGVFNLSGGVLNKSTGGDMVIGRGGSHGIFNMTGGTFTKDNVNPLIVGQGGGVGELNQSAGTITTTGEYWMGVDNGSIGTNNISGTAQMTVHNYVTIGRNGMGVVNMSGGEFSSDSNPFIVGIWGGSQGIWNQSGGALNVNQDIWIGQGAGNTNSHGVINLSGGTITNSGWLAIGRESAQGVLNITGGTMVKTGGGNISMAHNTGASATVNISGTGTFICESGETWVGENAGQGAWNMNGGTAILGVVHLAQNADATGVMNLNGGSLTATEISTGNNGAAQRELNLNGGIIVAGADNANFIHDLSAANILTNGAIIDTASYTVGVNQALLGDINGDGGLVKNGSGTLYLNGVNTYTNVTQVNAGALGGTGTIAGPVNVASGASLAPGASIGTLTINNALTLAAGSSTHVEVSMAGGGTNDMVTGLTSVSYDGTLVVTNVGGSALIPGAEFQLSNAGAPSGNFVNAASVAILPAGTGSFNPATGKLTIISSGVASFNPVSVSGGNLILTGDGGAAPGSAYTLLMSTNVATPLPMWETNTTGVLDGSGMFSNSIPINTLDKARFFDVRVP